MVKSSATFIGTLYIVATPIGNLNDISLRALETLKMVDSILAEDTRHSLTLLSALGIKKPLISLHAHNEHEKSQPIIEALQAGKCFALISDAGTPLISDPGFELVRLAQENKIPVVPIPGACALITALCAAGVPCDSFSFVGFLPAKQLARKNKLLACLTSEHTTVCYESTHRILDCLDDLIEICQPNYEIVLAKELTKTFERFIRGSSSMVKKWLSEDSAHCKGEFVLILPPHITEKKSQEEAILSLLLEELSLKQAVKIASIVTKTAKNDLYKIALSLQEK